jgi:hypothetical protein
LIAGDVKAVCNSCGDSYGLWSYGSRTLVL